MGRQACSGCPANAVYVHLASRLDTSARVARNILAEARNFRAFMTFSQVVSPLGKMSKDRFSCKIQPLPQKTPPSRLSSY